MVCSYTIVCTNDYANFRQAVKNILEETEDLHVIRETGAGLEVLNFLKLRIRTWSFLISVTEPFLRSYPRIVFGKISGNWND